jgi:chemosensory pili system protein ChpC
MNAPPLPRSEVRGMVLDIGGVELLLPSATVAEVVYCEEPSPNPQAPPWLLGSVTWREREIPLVSVRAGGAVVHHVRRGPRARTAVCYAPAVGSALPYLGLLAVGPPRLTVFRPEAMRPAEGAPENPFVLRALTYMDRPAWIPDLDAVEAAVLEAIKG